MIRPVDQTLFGEPYGNCFAACVATIFGLGIDDVPNFCAHQDWQKRCADWFGERGFAVLRLTIAAADLDDGRAIINEWLPGTLAIVTGKADRGLLHATVWRGGELVHDPHPSRAGLLDVFDVIVFVPHQPRFEATRVARLEQALSRLTGCADVDVFLADLLDGGRDDADPLDDPSHQAFLATCAKDCRCPGTVCAGVAAGGLCDTWDDDEPDDGPDDFDDQRDSEEWFI